MAAVSCTPSAATAHNTAVLVSATALTVNDASTFDANQYPTEDAIGYYLEATGSGATTLRSPNYNGPAFSEVWMFDTVTTYTVAVKKVADDSTVASTTIVVS